jgi:molecular chaperone GrpE
MKKHKISIEDEINDTEQQADSSEALPDSESENEPDEDKDTVIQMLENRCKAAEEKAEAEHETFLRTLAEYNNFKRRSQEEMALARKYGSEDLVIRLLPLLDNFERGLKAAEENTDFDALHSGVMIILRQMIDILEKEGLKSIEAVGQPFDPNVHEAVMREENSELPDSTIIEEFQKGYMVGDKVVRPSMVKVSFNPQTDIAD